MAVLVMAASAEVKVPLRAKGGLPLARGEGALPAGAVPRTEGTLPAGAEGTMPAGTEGRLPPMISPAKGVTVAVTVEPERSTLVIV